MRPADTQRERRLSGEEYAALGIAVRQAEQSMWPAAVGATRFLALTGWRSDEVLGLTRLEVDLVRRTARLTDTKTGFSIRPLSNATCDVLTGLAVSEELVFPAARGEGRMT
jgi:integrase